MYSYQDVAVAVVADGDGAGAAYAGDAGNKNSPQRQKTIKFSSHTDVVITILYSPEGALNCGISVML